MRHRFFVGNKTIIGGEIRLTGENAAHASVLRLTTGEEIVICNGDATDYHCVVINCSKTEVIAKILHSKPNSAEPSIAVTLYQAIPKTGKMEEIVERCTQIGVSGIVPVITSRCVAKASDRDTKKVGRWQKIAQSAASQSQRGRIPQIRDVMMFESALQEAKTCDTVFVCYEDERQISLKEFLQNLKRSLSSIALFIGPEGGFSDAEVSKFKENSIATVSLGPRILRTELAGVVASANILYELGERI